MNEKLSINLTVEEVNAILSALSKFPYDQVSDLIHNIKFQAEVQLQPEPDPA